MVRADRLSSLWLIGSVAAVALAAIAGLTIGPAEIPLRGVLLELADRLPWVSADSGLSTIEANIVWEVRAPRVVLGALVGATLALSGASYQAVFRNPLADPYLLGAAAGAGLGATVAIVAGWTGGYGPVDPVPALAFLGALGAVALTWALGRAGGEQRSPATLLLAGVAITSFLTAIQTFVLQRNSETIRQVYTWILGRLNTASWDEVWLLAPYAALTAGAIVLHRRVLDVMRLGDTEAASLGIRPGQVRAIVVVAASLGTAAAVSVSGLIAFVGLIVPHTIRLLAGASNRVVLPLSVLLGAAFLMAVDLVGRTATQPAEIPIGVITAFCGAPFFVLVLRTSRGAI